MFVMDSSFWATRSNAASGLLRCRRIRSKVAPNKVLCTSILYRNLLTTLEIKSEGELGGRHLRQLRSLSMLSIRSFVAGATIIEKPTSESYLTSLIVGLSGGFGHIVTSVGVIVAGGRYRNPSCMVSWDL